MRGADVLVDSRCSFAGSRGLLPGWGCPDRSSQICALGLFMLLLWLRWPEQGAVDKTVASSNNLVASCFLALAEFELRLLPRPAVAARRGKGWLWRQPDRDAAGAFSLRRGCAAPREGLHRLPHFLLLFRPAVVAWGQGRWLVFGRPAPVFFFSSSSVPALEAVRVVFFLTRTAVEAGKWVRTALHLPELVEGTRSLRRFGFLWRFLCVGLSLPPQTMDIGLATPRSTMSTRSRACFSSARGSSAWLQRQLNPPPSQVVSSPAGTGVAPS
jgi:hypothetical protein